MGLASESLPRDQVLPRALKQAKDIAANTAPVLGRDREARAVRKASPRRCRRCGSAKASSSPGRETSPNSKEGVLSFLEKRAPAWKLSHPEGRAARSRGAQGHRDPGSRPGRLTHGPATSLLGEHQETDTAGSKTGPHQRSKRWRKGSRYTLVWTRRSGALRGLQDRRWRLAKPTPRTCYTPGQEAGLSSQVRCS